MKKLVAVLFVLVVCAYAQESIDTTFAEYMQKGDEAYDNYDNETALQNYLLAYQADTTNCDAAWKVSRGYVDVGEFAEKDKQEEYYTEGEKFARLAIIKCPDNADAHLSLAVAVGRVALISGKKKQVQLSAVVKEESLKALELDPNKDIAHHVLARWHRKVANLGGIQKTFAKILYGGLPDASNEKSVEHFQKAIDLNPTYINHHLELGLTYEEMDEWELAKAEYEKVAELPISTSDDEDHKKTAAERLLEVNKKIK
ncbi:hypothetical protein JXQ31_17735 [candidate division KSB1 bacterium]|nr:hypothetical protein [candidate division KSB1 bacterium]